MCVQLLSGRVWETVSVKRRVRTRGKVSVKWWLQTESKTQAGCKIQWGLQTLHSVCILPQVRSLLSAVRSLRFTLTCLRDVIASIGHLEVAWDRRKLGQSSSPQTNSNWNWTLHLARLPLKHEISSVTFEWHSFIYWIYRRLSWLPM